VKRISRVVGVWLKPWFRRYGRSRVLIAVGCAAFLAIGTSVILITHVLVLEPELRQAAAQPNAAVAPLLWKIRFYSLFHMLTLSMLGFGVWWLAAMRPFSEFQRRVRTRLDNSKAAEELRVLTYWYERRSAQLEAALEANRTFREQSGRLSAEQQSILLSREAMLSMTQDAMLLTDAEGVVLDVSPATATLLHRTRESLSGLPFSSVAPLFDHRRDVPQEHPLPNYLHDAINKGVNAPRLDQALLINQLHESIPVLITTSVIHDAAGKAIGAMVRINRLDASAESAAQAYQATTPTDELSLPASSAGPVKDWATDLLSKEALEQRLDELARREGRADRSHALLLVRADGLVRISDTYGFWAGEQALWHAAQVFKEALEDRGTSYRVSNSRFAAVLTDCSMDAAMQLATQIQEAAERRELVWDGKPVSCTLSVAVVDIEAEEGRTALISKAEALLDVAKARGGNLVLQELPDDASTLRRREDQHWLTWLEPRLTDGRAHLIYQRMQALNEPATLPNLEVFLRVEDDDGVWLEPGHFIPALQRLHRTTELDLWVLKTLLDRLERDSSLLEAHAQACLNFAPTSLTDTEFASQVFELLAEASIPANRLCFEIDESFAIAQSATLQRFMNLIRPTGVRFALDRCHTTMGITHLRHLPVDTMKIHPRVTRHIESDPLDRTHLEWICQAAHLLGRKTAAINIESPATLQLLRNAGVDYAQGFAIGKYEMMLG